MSQGLEVAGLQYYPVAGAEPVALSEMTVWATGPQGDEEFLPYSIQTGQAHDEYWHGAHGIRVVRGSGNTMSLISPVIFNSGGLRADLPSRSETDILPQIVIAKNGDLVPCRPVVDESVLSLLQDNIEIMGESPRHAGLARKTRGWMLGDSALPDGQGAGKFVTERVRPLRVIFENSVEALRSGRNHAQARHHDASRFGGHVIVRGSLPPFAEKDMTLKNENGLNTHCLHVGDLVVGSLATAPLRTAPDVDGWLEALKIYGRHAEENPNQFRTHDPIIKVYSRLPGGPRTRDARPGLGLEGYPQVELGSSVKIRIGDEAHFAPRTKVDLGDGRLI